MNVGMAPARSITSHARRLYGQKYLGRYRFSRLVFAFDLFLVGVAATLLVFDFLLFLGSAMPEDGGISMTFTAAPLRAADDLPVRITIHAKDGHVHQNVRLEWRVPDWVEMVRAEPPIAKDGSLYIGRLDPGVDRTSLVVLHIRAAAGVSVPIDVSIQQNDLFGFRRTVVGRETRIIASSAVTAEFPLGITAAAPGASIPIVIRNTGAHDLSALTFRVADGPGLVSGASSLFLGEVAPGASHIVFVDLPVTSASSVALAWQIEDQAHIVAASSTRIEVYDVSSASASRALLVIDTPNGQASRMADVVSGQKLSALITPDEMATATRWSVVPFVVGADGEWSVAKPTSKIVTPQIPFSAEARYYSTSGDQIGVGPIHPIPGQSTRYWIVWSVDPGSSGLKDMTLGGILPANVRATGQFASIVSGSFTGNNGYVTWTVPSISPSSGQGPITFAFEAEIVPVRAQGSYPLMATSTIEALDAKTGVALNGTAPGDDSRWIYDTKAAATTP